MSGFFRPISPDNGLSDPAWWYWCPSLMVGDDGRWHMFASRWPKHVPMHPGWLAASEIVRAESDRPEGPFTVVEVVLPARGAAWWDGRMTHNPRVVRDGARWLMFYTGSTHPFPDPRPGEEFGLADPRVIVGRSNKRIGLAVADRPEGPWQRLPRPILDVRPDAFDSFLVSNAAPVKRADGSWYMLYKARASLGPSHSPYHGPMSIAAVVADDPSGPWRRIGQGPIFKPEEGELEDPFIWVSQRGIELIAKDMTGQRCGVPRGGFRAWSADGLAWHADAQVLVHDRRLQWCDGTEQRMGAMERTSYLFHDGIPTHLVAAVADGPDGIGGATRAWNVVLPLNGAQAQSSLTASSGGSSPQR